MMNEIININNPPRLLKLTDEALTDYIKCPNYFYFKYISKIPVNQNPTYHELVQRVIDAYMSKLMDGKVMTSRQFKKMWDDLVEEYPTVITEKKILDGFGMINQIDRYCRQNQVIIADINSPYQINFKPNIILSGKIGTIRYNKTSLELFVTETSQKLPDDFLLNMSLRLTLQAYAIEKTTDCKIDGIHIYHIKSGKELYTRRSQRDYERLERVIKDIGFSIRNELFYPREDYTCPQCKFKNYCGYAS